MLTTVSFHDCIGHIYDHFLTHIQCWFHNDVGNIELDLDLKPGTEQHGILSGTQPLDQTCNHFSQ